MNESPNSSLMLRNRAWQWAERLRVGPKIIRIQTMKRKWGSCSTSGIVTFAADLAGQPPTFQDVVVVHELLHLRIPKHGRLFNALMTLYLPEWRQFKTDRSR